MCKNYKPDYDIIHTMGYPLLNYLSLITKGVRGLSILAGLFFIFILWTHTILAIVNFPLTALLLTITAYAKYFKAMIYRRKVVFFANFFLQLFYFLFVELYDLATLNAY